MRKVNYKEKGITLVALVITIIILLILAGVTLNSALSQNGLFKRAQDAGEKYKESEKNEEIVLGEYEKNIDGIIKNEEKIDKEKCIGKYIEGYEIQEKSTSPCIITKEQSGYTSNQEFTTEELEWKIWDYDGKTLKIITEKPTTQKLYLQGVTGYNDGVYLINEVCRQCYGPKETNGIEVSNLKRSDIQNVITYDYTTYTRSDINKRFGEVTVYNNCNYPKIWGEFDKQWKYLYKDGKVESETDKEGLIWEEENNYTNCSELTTNTGSVEYKESSWFKDFGTTINEDDWKNKEYYNMLFLDKENQKFESEYWLSCRYTLLNPTSTSNTSFGINYVRAKNDVCDAYGYLLYYSDSHTRSMNFSLRPVVSIDLEKSGYKLVENEILDGEVINYKISK